MTVRPPTSVTVRAADLGDVPSIRSIDGLSASSVALLDHDLTAADRCCLVATTTPAAVAGDARTVDDVEVVGYAAAIVQLGEAQVIDLVVAPAHRRRGVGGRLLDALLAETAARGAGPVSLEVATDNAAAQALYRQRGFVVEGRRPRYYRDGTDALIMYLHPTGAGGCGGASSDPRVDLPASGLAGAEAAATSTSLRSPRPRPDPTPEREDD